LSKFRIKREKPERKLKKAVLKFARKDSGENIAREYISLFEKIKT